MAFNIAELIGSVSGMDTREQIEYIALEKLHDDPNNFYSLDGIEELAANIEMFGMQQPLRIRPDGDGFIIVSGHRRKAAALMIRESGSTMFDGGIACIVEQADENPAVQELRLIYANASTRKLTVWDQTKQADRIEALLYQLQEEGYEFPGRMRDHVAEVLSVSKSKLARLKAIRNNLAPSIMTDWFEKDQLNETTAYELSTLPADRQERIVRLWTAQGASTRTLSQRKIEDMAEAIDRMDRWICPEVGGKCPEKALDGLVRHIAKAAPWQICHCEKGCCHDCPDLEKCPNSCAAMADEKAARKADTKEKKAEWAREQEEQDRPKREKNRATWVRFGEARERAGISIQEYAEQSEIYYGEGLRKTYEKKETGAGEYSTYGDTPYKYIRQQELEDLCLCAAALECSIDYLLGRTDVPEVNRGVSIMDTVLPEWHTELPTRSGRVLADLECGGQVLRYKAVRFDCVSKDFYLENSSQKINAKLLRWMELPED